MTPATLFAGETVITRETVVDELETAPVITARNRLTDRIVVKNGHGRDITLQMQSGSTWKDKATFTLTEDEVQTVDIKYPKDWWYVRTSKWRLVIDEAEEVTEPELLPEEEYVPAAGGNDGENPEGENQEGEIPEDENPGEEPPDEEGEKTITRYTAYTSP